jgi:hypothetical protein
LTGTTRIKPKIEPALVELWFKPQPSGQRVEELLDYVAEIYGAGMHERLAPESAGVRIINIEVVDIPSIA